MGHDAYNLANFNRPGTKCRRRVGYQEALAIYHRLAEGTRDISARCGDDAAQPRYLAKGQEQYAAAEPVTRRPWRYTAAGRGNPRRICRMWR